MPFNVQDFRASLTFDGARASLFEVLLNPPPGLGNLAGGQALMTNQVAFKARASQLPPDTMSAINVPYFGREIKVSGVRTFPDWSMTIINDEDFAVRNFMESWMAALNSHVGNLRDPALKRMADYQADATVLQYAKTGEVIKTYHFVGVFPTDVAEIPLDWANGDAVEEYGITFAYQWWTSDTTIQWESTVSGS
jgi:hypothetical protein